MALFLFGLVSVIAGLQTVISFLFILGLVFRLNKKDKNVCIVVLGDIGRSPRMQYHALSYLKEDFRVNIVGFRGSSPIAALVNNDNVSYTYLTSPLKKPTWIPGFVYYIFKAVFQSLQLLIVLLFVEKPGHFLVQNPPSIPTLAVVWFISCIKGSYFVIDWHNYAYTILSLNVKRKDNILVKFAKWFEGTFGSLSDQNICVTNAMKDDLKSKWNIEASVLYDRPPEHFKQTNVSDKHELFKKLSAEEKYSLFRDEDCSTIFSTEKGDCVIARNDRPAIIISSTSWTEDEDFSILLRALEIYEIEKKMKQSSLPTLICIITGKGPLKEYYQNLIQKKNFEHISIITPWLSPDDYPKIIGSGDLGICLHTSSSGLDLPMKVVDMFGCGLPVCAVKFSCLHELVIHGKNGLVFNSHMELAEQMMELLNGFPDSCLQLDEYRNNLSSFQNLRWHENWKNVVLPMIAH